MSKKSKARQSGFNFMVDRANAEYDRIHGPAKVIGIASAPQPKVAGDPVPDPTIDPPFDPGSFPYKRPR